MSEVYFIPNTTGVIGIDVKVFRDDNPGPLSERVIGSDPGWFYHVEKIPVVGWLMVSNRPGTVVDEVRRQEREGGAPGVWGEAIFAEAFPAPALLLPGGSVLIIPDGGSYIGIDAYAASLVPEKSAA
jgi:hypothetical protein